MDVENSQTGKAAAQVGDWPRSRVIQWAATAAIVLVAEIVFFAGYSMLSYVIDAVAVAVFFGLRKARE